MDWIRRQLQLIWCAIKKLQSNQGIQSIQEGDNITVDNTDPLNPIVSSTASGGTTIHNDLTGIQGGQAGQYYHLTQEEYENLGELDQENVNIVHTFTLADIGADGTEDEETLNSLITDWINSQDIVQGETESHYFILVDGDDSGGGDTTELMTNITYSELKTKRDNSELIVGHQYRIIDYVTTVGSQIDYANSAGNPFDIIVIADSENKLNEKARAIRRNGDTYFPNYTKFETWELKYSLDNDELRYEWADSTNGKGVIYWLKDENNNECPYDFKNIRFKRYKIIADTSVNQSFSDLVDRYYAHSKTIKNFTVDNNDFIFAYTFYNEDTTKDISVYHDEDNTYAGRTVNNNTIGKNIYRVEVDDIGYALQTLNNSVFSIRTGDYMPNQNKIGFDFERNTLGSVFSNTFGNIISGNTFGNAISGNTFGSGISDNTFGNSIWANTFGNGINRNTFDNRINRNTFGSGINDNTFGNDISGNTFGNSIWANTFGNEIADNTFGNTIVSNTFGNEIGYNTFGNRILYNTFQSDLIECDLGDGFSSADYGGTGITLVVENGVKGGTFDLQNHQRLDITSIITQFTTPPKMVYITKSATSGTYIFESRVSASNIERFDYVLPTI